MKWNMVLKVYGNIVVLGGAVALVDGRYVSEYCPKCKEG